MGSQAEIWHFWNIFLNMCYILSEKNSLMFFRASIIPSYLQEFVKLLLLEYNNNNKKKTSNLLIFGCSVPHILIFCLFFLLKEIHWELVDMNVISERFRLTLLLKIACIELKCGSYNKKSTQTKIHFSMFLLKYCHWSYDYE